MFNPSKLGNTFAPYSFKNININALTAIVTANMMFLLFFSKNFAAIKVVSMLNSINIKFEIPKLKYITILITNSSILNNIYFPLFNYSAAGYALVSQVLPRIPSLFSFCSSVLASTVCVPGVES